MSANKYLLALPAISLVLASQIGFAAEAAQDSAYQWGRWAVLSPAAGGQPFRQPAEPGAVGNYRPTDYFDPVVQTIQPPPVVSDPRDRLPVRPPPVVSDPRDRLPPRPPSS